MKQMIAWTLAGAAALSLCGCTGSSQETGSSAGESAGAWTVQEAETAALPEEEQKIFEEGAAQWDGGELKAAALLAAQVVAGTNYCYLAYSSLSQEYVLVYIYRDLEDDVTLSDVTSLDLSAESYGEADSTENLTGGWMIAEDMYAAPTEADQKVLEDAVEDITGSGYELVAVLGTQVVSGTNYRMLCRITAITAEPSASLAMVTVWQNPDGKAELSSVVPFSAAA